MKKALLVDDQTLAIQVLKKLLIGYKDLEVCATASTLDEAYTAIQKLHPDIVFLDIELKEENSFDLLNKLSEIKFAIIFTTAHPKYAVKAFRYSAVDYLLKPIDPQQLKNALNKIKERRQLQNLTQQKGALKGYTSAKPVLHKLAVPTPDGFLLIKIGHIITCEAHSNYTDLLLFDGKKVTITRPLKQVEDLLKDQNFFRVHQSYLVNLEYVNRYYRGKGGYVQLIDGSTVSVSTRKKEEFLKVLTGR